MSEPFRLVLQVRWSDLDANGHMANSRYLDHATHTRFQYLATAGFGPADFAAAGVGPAISHEEIRFRRELRLLEEFTAELWLKGQSEDGSQFAMHSRFLKGDGSVAAEITARARWFDVRNRKVVAPPPGLFAAMSALARTADFEVL